MRHIHQVIIHHTATSPTTTRSQIREMHLARGWRDIGYHRLVWWDGHDEPGRPEGFEAAHCLGHNRGSLGISLVGDFTRGPVPDAQWRAALRIVAGWCRQYGVAVDQVKGHGELNPTQCPGFDAAAFRADLSALLEETCP